MKVDADVSSLGVQVVNDSDTVFAYQLGVGFGYEVGEKTTLDVGYRYLNTADPELTDAGGSDFTTEYNSHTAMVGLRYRF